MNPNIEKVISQLTTEEKEELLWHLAYVHWDDEQDNSGQIFFYTNKYSEGTYGVMDEENEIIETSSELEEMEQLVHDLGEGHRLVERREGNWISPSEKG